MNEDIEAPAVREMRRMLRLWLARKGWEMERLVGWLRREGLPASDVEQEPYAWLLDGLPLADERYRAENELAARVARLLEMQPDAQPPGEQRDELLYNLLMLCAGLNCPTQLADPLYAMFRRGKLAGSWQGTVLRQVLESALITNQRDDRLQTVWHEMLTRSRHEFLTGDEYAGFEGIRLMPASEAARGRPALDAIGAALAAMAVHLERKRTRRVEFHSLLNRVLHTYPGRPTWNSDLVYQADNHYWPGWAVECLPKLFIPQATLDPDEPDVRALIWHYIPACLPTSCKYEVREKLCNGHVLEVSLSRQAYAFVQSIAPLLERNRLSMTYASERAMRGLVVDALAQLEVQASYRNDHEAALALLETRKQMLESVGIIPDIDTISKSLQIFAKDRQKEKNREAEFLKLVAPVVEMYPELNLKSRASEMNLPNWAVKCLKKVA